MQDILASVKWYLIVVLSCISWWLVMLSILSHACWPAVCLWKNFVQILCPFFTAHVLIRLYAFWCWCMRSLYILNSNSLSNTLFAIIFSYSVQLLSCLTLYDPMACSMPGFPVHHQLLELAQTHVHRVGDAIQPSHPLSSPSPPAFSLSRYQDLGYSVGIFMLCWYFPSLCKRFLVWYIPIYFCFCFPCLNRQIKKKKKLLRLTSKHVLLFS